MIKKLLFIVLLLHGPAFAAFPVIDSTSSGTDEVLNATHVTFTPATVTADDLLVMCLSHDGPMAVDGPGDGWTELFDTNEGSMGSACYCKDADGTEDSEQVDFTYVGGDPSEIGAYIGYAISGTFDGGCASIEAGTTAGANSTSPDPPDFNPSWGTEDTLWLAHSGANNDTTNTTYTVHSYPDNQLAVDCTPLGCSNLGQSTDELATASQNPGAMTLDNSQSWTANTFKPAAGRKFIISIRYYIACKWRA